MHKKKLALMIVLLLAFGISSASKKTPSPQIQPTPPQPPHGPITQEQAIAIAKGVAQGWHEPNAQVVTGNQ